MWLSDPFSSVHPLWGALISSSLGLPGTKGAGGDLASDQLLLCFLERLLVWVILHWPDQEKAQKEGCRMPGVPPQPPAFLFPFPSCPQSLGTTQLIPSWCLGSSCITGDTKHFWEHILWEQLPLAGIWRH